MSGPIEKLLGGWRLNTLDRKKLEKVEVGIKRDPVSKTLVSEVKVNVNGVHQKIYRDWIAGRESLEAARLWRSAIKKQHQMKHPTMKLRSNGTWVVHLPATEKYQTIKRDFGYEFRAAKDWATEAYADRLRGRWTDGSNTVEGVWLCYLRDGKRPSDSTLHSYEAIWRNDLQETWGAVLISEIGVRQVQKWIDNWTESIPKLEHAYRVLRLILSHAVEEELIAHNPASKRKLPTRKKIKSPAIPPEKLMKLQEHPSRESDRLAIAMALQSGLRFSEWSVLKVCDFDSTLLRVTVDEHQTRDRYGRTTVRVGHKTSIDKKTAGITIELAERLEKYISENALESDDLLFPSPAGRVWRYNNFRVRIWEPARVAAGIESLPYMTGTHSTRRTTVTLAHQAGLSAADIRGQTKHSGIAIIQDTYLQTANEAEHLVASAVHSSIGLPR